MQIGPEALFQALLFKIISQLMNLTADPTDTTGYER